MSPTLLKTFFWCFVLLPAKIDRFSTMATKKPKLIVFDLDYTLWPFWVDTHVTPPFRKTSDGKIVDSFGAKIKCYPDVPEILENLHNEGYQLAVASRTSEIEGAKSLVNLFGWDKYFQYKEIYPGSKVTHFNRFKQLSGLEFKDMLFFDDEHRNIYDLTREGVVSILVPKGVNRNKIAEGLAEFARNSS